MLFDAKATQEAHAAGSFGEKATTLVDSARLVLHLAMLLHGLQQDRGDSGLHAALCHRRALELQILWALISASWLSDRRAPVVVWLYHWRLAPVSGRARV